MRWVLVGHKLLLGVRLRLDLDVQIGPGKVAQAQPQHWVLVAPPELGRSGQVRKFKLELMPPTRLPSQRGRPRCAPAAWWQAGTGVWPRSAGRRTTRTALEVRPDVGNLKGRRKIFGAINKMQASHWTCQYWEHNHWVPGVASVLGSQLAGQRDLVEHQHKHQAGEQEGPEVAAGSEAGSYPLSYSFFHT